MKNRFVALRMMIALFLLQALPAGVTAASVLSELEIVSGARGTILFLKSDNEIDCNISKPSSTIINVILSGCIYGLQDFSYSKFDKKSPVTSLVASEKKNGAIVQLQITMKDPIDDKPVFKRKNTDIYILLSKKPGIPFNWKAPSVFENKSKPTITEKTGQQDSQSGAISSNRMINKNEEKPVALLTDISMVYREQICRINFQFNSFVKGTIVRNRDSVVCSFKGVKSGLDKSIFEIHPRAAYKRIIISETKGNENTLTAKIVVDTTEYMSRTSIVFGDSLHFTVMAINKSSYNAFWSAHSGSSWEHELTYVKPYEIDLKKMGERAEKDVALNLGNGPVFRVGDFLSEPSSVETAQNEIPAVRNEEKFSEPAPVVTDNITKKEPVPEAAVSQMKPEVSRIGEHVELKSLVPAMSSDSIVIQKVSQQINGEEIFRSEKGEADLVIRYNQKGRDPFKPLIRDSLAQRGKASIDQLQLVGVLIDRSDKVALFEDKSSKKQAFTLRENDAVENGKVLKVFPDRVVFLLTEFGISRSFTLRLKGINTDKEARVR